MLDNTLQLNIITDPEERYCIQQRKLEYLKKRLQLYLEGMNGSDICEPDLLTYISFNMLPLRLGEIALRGTNHQDPRQKIIDVGIAFVTSEINGQFSLEIDEYKAELQHLIDAYYDEWENSDYKQYLLERLLGLYMPRSLMWEAVIFDDEDPTQRVEDWLTMLEVMAG